MVFNDRIFGILMIVLAVAYGWGATQFPEPFGGSEAVGPETFPLLLAVVLGLSSLYMVVRPDPDNAWPWSRTGIELIVAVVVLVLYAMLLQPLGFIISTALAVGTLCWRMGSRPVKAYITGAVSGVVVYLVFSFALDLALPLGILSFLEVG
ncbi:MULTISPECIES: tripartite tricarboxylate transporter TctB family protein [Halomonadaceae]|jgi:putative tricarboxylic transport membrane protein|uniref:Tripartite tricarboxylate transporter TctB family protein n=1 Tax=Vreelandella janggokensis TaxID=370767 RepID=A0ABT4IW07_9GAMM|nr:MULTISPECIES: tripartite tricarboxylate transporter TctB family protein [Halomonas]MCW4150687.1 tripartite tricarboxylate transporter TctB family protein [Halomonas sp. 18H]MCZ0927376.1 tripartite tricarboxylate transporter TctB family protein [Halomonas janggokensis]MCZ0929884.1 tripartite tricarboxylate transporter TctB family protein [Halomonas janggokensis]MDR5885928.1 tripartite tricarboxylate transporter TctB family protein [Halomonas janggokensis]QPL48225.1 tripartite tricarboxylate 